MPWRAMNALAKSLELSSCAAAFVGPKIFEPAAWYASTTPLASGASGPTTVKVTRSVAANATRSGIAVTETLVRCGSRAVPALPGATYTLPTRGDCAIFHASACSRPPPPMTRTFNASLSVERYAAKNVQDTAVIDAPVERGDERRQQREFLVTQCEHRQYPRKRHSMGDVRSLENERGIAKSGLDVLAFA